MPKSDSCFSNLTSTLAATGHRSETTKTWKIWKGKIENGDETGRNRGNYPHLRPDEHRYGPHTACRARAFALLSLSSLSPSSALCAKMLLCSSKQTPREFESPRESWEGSPELRGSIWRGPRTSDGTGAQPGIGDVSLTITTSFSATPALPPLHPPPLPPAPYRLSPSSSILLPRGQPLRRTRVRPHAIACAATASPKPVREDRVGATLRPCACAPRWRSQALGRPYAILTHGRWVAGGGASFCMRPATGPPQRLSAGEQGRGGRGSGCRAPATALPAHCTAHRPSCHGGELSASARHLAAFRRLPADRRTTPAPTATPAIVAACLRACVRRRACVCCVARPSLSACYVTCVWSHVYDARVRGVVRTTPRILLIKYYKPGRSVDLPRHHLCIGRRPRRHRPGSAAQ